MRDGAATTAAASASAPVWLSATRARVAPAIGVAAKIRLPATPTPLAPPPPEPWFHDKPDAYAECAAPPSAAPAVALPAPYERCDGAEEGWASPPGGNELHFHYRAFSAAVTAARRVGDPGVCCYLVWEFPSFRPDDGS